MTASRLTYANPRHTPLDVRWDWRCRAWVATGPEGDYGLADTQAKAIDIAIDAAVTGGGAYGAPRRICVWSFHGTLDYTITRVRGRRPSAQFFQEDAE